MKWYPRACPTCNGDLHDDLQDRGWLSCMMCARSFQAIDVLAVRRAERQEQRVELPEAA